MSTPLGREQVVKEPTWQRTLGQLVDVDFKVLAQLPMFEQTANVLITGGTFTQVDHHFDHQCITSPAFERLQNAVAPGAFHNSGERFDPPRCHPRTRTAVIERITNWVLGKESTGSFVMWLNGAAGAGKSAIAQTIAELCHDAGLLLASFFFSRSDPHRNQTKAFFPTLAYQISCAIPEARTLLEKSINRDPLIFTRSLDAQLASLIVEPLKSLAASGYFDDIATSPRLVVIDGLDEVLDLRVQSKLLEILSGVVKEGRLPLIFMVASRPEQQILYAFNSEPLSELTARLPLDDTFHPDADIQLFLHDSFDRIKNAHPRRYLLSSSWPSPDIVYALVKKASGQFIYASTVTKFVASIRHQPADRLDIILGLRAPRNELPFAELDALYMHILSTLEDPEGTLLIVGMLLLRPDWENNISTIPGIEWFLGLNPGDAELLLADLSALISWDNDSERSIRILHASLGDFLLDPVRSGKFFIDTQAIRTTAACHCFRHIKLRLRDLRYESLVRYEYIVDTLHEHLSEGQLTQELREHLREPSIIEHLLEDMDMHVSLGLGRRFHIPTLFWTRLPYFIVGIQEVGIKDAGLNESEYQTLRNCNYDQIVKREFDQCYRQQPSLAFLLCLRCIIEHDDRAWTTRTPVQHLTDWNMEYHRALVDQPGRFDVTSPLIFAGTSTGLDVLREFLEDESRSGEYATTPEAYAAASLQCLQYLCRHRLGPPIDLQYSGRHFGKRRHRPWQWKHIMKELDRRHSRLFKAFPRASWARRQRRLNPLPRLYYNLELQRMYANASLLGLTFLPEALKRASSHDSLVIFANEERAFSRRALQFPVQVKKCRDAIAAYLERVLRKDASAVIEDECRGPEESSECQLMDHSGV